MITYMNLYKFMNSCSAIPAIKKTVEECIIGVASLLVFSKYIFHVLLLFYITILWIYNGWTVYDDVMTLRNRLFARKYIKKLSFEWPSRHILLISKFIQLDISNIKIAFIKEILWISFRENLNLDNYLSHIIPKLN